MQVEVEARVETAPLSRVEVWVERGEVVTVCTEVQMGHQIQVEVEVRLLTPELLGVVARES
tara:strand:- start:72 stop:254 length:183 start_codon:yes stop_codon:yes gene_type:complete